MKSKVSEQDNIEQEIEELKRQIEQRDEEMESV